MPERETIAGIVAFAGRLEGIDVQVLAEGLELARLHRQVEQVMEGTLAGWGLTARQVEIMESLYHSREGTRTPADLSAEVGLTRSAMTGAVDALERLGLAVRGPHPGDRRMVAIRLTPMGREFLAERLPERYRKFYRAMECLTKYERSVLLRAHQKFLANLLGEAECRNDGEGGSK